MMVRRTLAVLVFLALAAARPSAQLVRIITIQRAQTSGITATTTTRDTTILPTQAYRSVSFLIRITDAGTATGTLQIFLQDSQDGGTTWDDLVSSNTYAFGAAVTNQRFFISTLSVPSSIGTATVTNLTQGSVSTQETMTAATARQGPIGDRIRVREKVSSPSGSPVGATYVITGLFR
jgi:hypothetical protein